MLFSSVIYFVNRERACYSITRIIFNVYICLNDTNIYMTKVDKHDGKPKY